MGHRAVIQMKKIACLLLTACLIIIGAAAANIPEPTEAFYVADFAGVLSRETSDHIVAKNIDLYERTGAQIVVATVDFLGGEDIGDYAYQMFNYWEIGSAEKNNGVLLLLAIGEDNYWALQGKGLERELPSSELGDLLYEYLEDDFAAGNYDAGVRKVFDAIYSKVDNIYRYSDQGGKSPGYTIPQPVNEDKGSYVRAPLFGLFFGGASLISAIIIIFFIVIFILAITSPFRRIRRGVYPRPYRTWWRPWGFWGFGRTWHHHHRHGPPPPPPPPPPRVPPHSHTTGSDIFRGGGGFTRGGGAGRGSSSVSRSSGVSRGSFGGSSFKGGGSFRGGGGSTRGGGAGRK
ncbi:MAG: TPM domain-containing protein [Clostridiales bacterium]|nr:TPM domain-containing protein [Clostridiales bacterium]